MTSGQVQKRKSAIHELPVKSEESDRLRIRNEYSVHAQKISSDPRSRFLLLTQMSADENGATREKKLKASVLWTVDTFEALLESLGSSIFFYQNTIARQLTTTNTSSKKCMKDSFPC